MNQKLVELIIKSATAAFVATIVGGTIGASQHRKYREAQKIRDFELEKSRPAEYWEAQKAKIEADAKAEADVRAKKHELDKMEQQAEAERKKAADAARIEFEKNAPESYWRAKEAEAHADVEKKKAELEAKVKMK